MQNIFAIKCYQSRKSNEFDNDELLYDIYLTFHTLKFQNKIEENIADV